MPYCPNCGTETNDRFCAKCGAAVSAPPSGAAPGGPPPAAGSGLQENLACALCYVLGLITGILFLVLEPHNRNPKVKFHAFQSIFFNIAYIAIWILLTIISMFMSVFALILVPIHLLVALGAFLLWLYLMWKAYAGEMVVLPIIGPIARQQAGI